MSLLQDFLSRARSEPQLIGILNVTPDSFSDGGEHNEIDPALKRARQMADEGASCIDVGGESTRPGADPVSAEDELARTLPVTKALSEQGLLVSIDTYKGEVAEAALKAGAHIVNDVWGMTRSPDLAHITAAAGAAIIITYNRGTADPAIEIVGDMHRFFEKQIKAAEQAGVAPDQIILDPGIGFGKTWQQNYQILSSTAELHQYGKLILIGVSRKSLIGHLTGAPVDRRLPGTLAAGLMTLNAGAHVFRVHDVTEHKQALDVWAACQSGLVE